MDRIFCVLLLSVLFLGCRQGGESPREAMVLCGSVGVVSKTDALTAGDAVAVFARIDGTEHYFLEAAKYAVGEDGHSLTYGSTVYYPETEQVVNFYAYVPYHTGTFSVPSDQSTPAALKQADLCWASASSTPVPTAVALTFQHLFARLIVQTNEPTKQIACQVVPSGTLNPATGVFTLNSTKSEVYTTGNELILPAQPLTRLVLAVSGVDYVFEGPIALLPGQTTSLSLTFNPTTKTATLAGTSTTNWLATTKAGDPSKSVSNALSFYWVPAHWRAAEIDKVVLTVKQGTSSADYTIAADVTHSDETFRFSLVANGIGYPYTIEKVALYKGSELVQTTTRHLGGVVYKSGAHTFGINAQPINPPAPSDYVKIGSLYWAKGNLIAVSKDNNRECKIGAPEDGGIYFRFGSLIGYKGGNQINGGTGVGIPTPVIPEGTQPEERIVWPEELEGTPKGPGDGEGIATLDRQYFNYSVAPWETAKKNIREFAVRLAGDKGVGAFATGRYIPKGVGDPCSYYLGRNWRMPTTEEYILLCNNQTSSGSFPACGALWTNFPVNGSFFAEKQLFFPAVGTCGLWGVLYAGYYWSSSVGAATKGFYFGFNNTTVFMSSNYYVRSQIFSARCVSDAP